MNEYMDEITSVAAPKQVYACFVASTIHFLGNNIKEHLKDCDEIILIAITLGLEIEKVIRKAEIVDMTKSVLLDMAASDYIESVHENLQDKLKIKYSKLGLHLTTAYSPGYGDFPLSHQKDICQILKTQRIGILPSSSFILTPRKSITSIIGVSQKPVEGALASCDSCYLKETCNHKLCKRRR